MSPTPQSPERPALVLPPWLVPGVAREGFRESLSRARWSLGAYWLLTGSGYVVLSVTAAMWWHGEAVFTGALILSSALGVLLGNALAVARVRVWVVQLAVHGTLLAACLSMSAGVPPLVVVTAFSFLWSMACGHFTLQRGHSLATLWIPTVCWTAALVTILERSGRLHVWQSGRKEGIWQPATLALLFLLVLEFFLFLAGQEHHHTQVWQAGAVASPVTLTRHRELGATRITKRGVAALVVLALLASVFTAKVSPYLFRTGPAPRRDNGREPRPDRPPSNRPRRVPDPDLDGLARALERAARNAGRRAREVLPFVPLFLLNRPLRRWWLLRALRRPPWPVTPSERATRLWRYVVIALGDAAMTPKPGETYEHAVARALELRTAQGHPLPEGLAETSELYQRVRFGLGIPAGALDALQESAERAFVSVRAPLTAWQRVASWWRRIE